jgi:hypothetical protein
VPSILAFLFDAVQIVPHKGIGINAEVLFYTVHLLQLEMVFDLARS